MTQTHAGGYWERDGSTIWSKDGLIGPSSNAQTGGDIPGEPSFDLDGDISLDWAAGGGFLSISIMPNGNASYAWLLNDGTKQHGTIKFGDGAFAILRAAIDEDHHGQ